MKKYLRQNVLYILLLPVYFVLHGFTENYDLVPLKPALKLIILYSLAGLALTGLFWLIFRHTTRSGLMAFFVLSYHFFFGAMQDTVNWLFKDSLFTRYSFILSLSLAGFIAIFWMLKKSKREFHRITLYLNLLLILLLAIDAAWLTIKISKKYQARIVPMENLTPCPDCPRPDIYLLVADGYPGKEQFREILGYDNSHFENELKKRGFHVTDSSLANYNFTFFSIGSLLNMNYLSNLSGSIRNRNNIPAGSKALKNNQVLHYLRQEGYRFYNFSLFDFRNSTAITRPTFWINDTRPITRQTFLYRLNRDLGYHLVTTLKIKPADSFPIDQDLKNNELVLTETFRIANTRTTRPKFVYTHPVMPHHPYYYDSTGTKTPLENLTRLHGFDKGAAVSYAVYANKKYLELIDSILASSANPPVIILVSDHGFREIAEAKDRKTMFLNLNAVLFPDRNYSQFYKGMSNVNLFRVILNARFRQRLPMINDSTIFLED